MTRVFFHVQHLLGIGHLKRAAILCRALADAGFEVTLASGGVAVPGVVPGSVKLVQLEPMAAADTSFKVLLDKDQKPLTDDWKGRRARGLLDAWREASAEVLVVELFPFGRRQLRFELLPLLEAAGDALVVCSVRDLLQAKPAREAETLELLERHFDRVLVHGDPRIAPFERSFPAAARIKALHYTGYVVDELPPAGSAAGRGEVIVSAGGGAVGRRLLETAIRARPLTRLRERTWRVLAGINAPSFEDLRALQGDGVVVERSRNDFTTLLRNCELSISQAGYNTVMETLQAGARGVVVPFAGVGETEQGMRARLLEQQGVLEVVSETELTAETLAEAVNRTPRPARLQVDLNGARRSAELLRQWTA